MLLCLTAWGCHAPITGDWTSLDQLGNGQKNQLAVSSDNSGDAVVFATPENNHAQWVRFHFSASWRASDTNFDFQMRCDGGPCNDDDFEMDCQIVDQKNGESNKL